MQFDFFHWYSFSVALIHNKHHPSLKQFPTILLNFFNIFPHKFFSHQGKDLYFLNVRCIEFIFLIILILIDFKFLYSWYSIHLVVYWWCWWEQFLKWDCNWHKVSSQIKIVQFILFNNCNFLVYIFDLGKNILPLILWFF